MHEDMKPRFFAGLKLNFPKMMSIADASVTVGFEPCSRTRLSRERTRLVLSASAITILPLARILSQVRKPCSAVAWKRIVPSVSSEKVMDSLLALNTVPVNAKSIGSVMFSNGMALALPTDVRTVPAISAKKMDKTAFIDFDLRN